VPISRAQAQSTTTARRLRLTRMRRRTPTTRMTMAGPSRAPIDAALYEDCTHARHGRWYRNGSGRYQELRLSTGRNPDSDPGTPEIYGGKINYHFYCNTGLIYTALGAWPPITAFLRDRNEKPGGFTMGAAFESSCIYIDYRLYSFTLSFIICCTDQLTL
jgi:hypothetical protein